MNKTNLILAMAAMMQCGQASADDAKQYHIPAQSLNNALLKFSADSGVETLFAVDKMRGLNSNALEGSMTSTQALTRLLQGSGMAYRFVDARTVTVEQPDANFRKTANVEDTPEPQPNSDTTLPKVTVEADAGYDPDWDADPYNTDYNRTHASTATKTDTPIMETPISVQTVTRAVMDDQQVVRLEDATKNVSGVQRILGDNVNDNFLIRGFDNAYNGLIFRNGYRLQSQANETANLERIEVLKGPASILYGRIEPGGLINIVTKKPLSEPYYSAQQQFGSYDFYRTTLDATGPILSDKSLLYRFNLAYQDNKSFRDFVAKERFFVAPSLSWQPSDATQINLNIEFRNEDRVEDTGIPAIGTRPAPIPISRFLGEPNTKLDNHGWIADLNWSHKFNDSWTIRNGVLANVVDYELNSITHSSLADDGTLTRGVAFWDTKRETESVYLELTGKAETFGVKHNMLFGGDYFHFDESINNGLLDFGDPSLLTTINIFDPRYTGVDFGALAQVRATSPNFFWHLADQWFGLYAQDQITIFDKFHFLIGGRYDWAENSSAFSTTGVDMKDDTIRVDGFRPRFGFLYHPWESFSIYANYVESLGSNNGRSSTGSPFSPQEASQYEVGFKSEAFDGRLNGSLAFFHIVKENLLTADPNFPGTGIQRAIGEARSQGIELDIKGQIFDDLNLVATYAFTDAIITKDTFNMDHRLANVPKHSGSLWAKYNITDAFSIGTGAYVVGQRMGDNENTFQLPGYVRWDAMAAYRWKIGKSQLTTQINVNNILDKTYYKSSDTLNGAPRLSSFPGEPLSVMGSIRLEY